MTRIRFFLPLVLLLVPALAQAEDDFRPEIRFHMGGAAIRDTDDSIRWVAPDRGTGRIEVAAGALVIPGLTLLGEFSHSRSEEWVLSVADTELTMRTGAIRARYAFDIVPIVRPYVTASAGVVVATNTVTTTNATLEARDVGFAWDAAGGIEAQTPGRFSAGFYTDFGYAWRSPMSFEGEPRRSDGPADTVDLGTIRVRGYQWRLGAFFAARF